MARLRVSAQPMLVVVSTGNELVEPGEPMLPHQIRRSNAYGVIAALRRHGFQRVADDHVRDDPDETARAAAAAPGHPRRADPVRRRLDGPVRPGADGCSTELGVRVVFHKIAQRPGKPLWFGVAPSGPAVFALPGNPVSTLVCLARYVMPALLAAMGDRSPADAQDSARGARHRGIEARAVPAGAHRSG